MISQESKAWGAGEAQWHTADRKFIPETDALDHPSQLGGTQGLSRPRPYGERPPDLLPRQLGQAGSWIRGDPCPGGTHLWTDKSKTIQ